METLENIGKRVFMLAAMKSICRYFFVCLPCAVAVALQIVFSNSSYESTA